MVSMETKRGLLMTLCAAAVNAHKTALGITATLKTETRYRRQTEVDTSRHERLAVMGDISNGLHTFFLEILLAGSETLAVYGTGDAYAVRHTFRVSFFYAYLEHATYSSSSQAAWDTITESLGATKGLLPQLREKAGEASGSDAVVYAQPQGAIDDVLPMDVSGEEAAHFLSFTVDVDDDY